MDIIENPRSEPPSEERLEPITGDPGIDGLQTKQSTDPPDPAVTRKKVIRPFIDPQLPEAEEELVSGRERPQFLAPSLNESRFHTLRYLVRLRGRPRR